MESPERDQRQSAYRILVASSLEKLQEGLADKWDSGKVASENSVEVIYAGLALASGERAYWKARVWDEKARASTWSEPTFFEMGLLSPSDWQGHWIAADKDVSSPLLRRSFDVPSKVRRARVYVSGLGHYELSINGRKVADRVLDPAPTTYDSAPSSKLGSRVLYATYDVTDSLRAGENVVGVMLGRGWFSFDPTVHALDSELPRQPYSDRPRLLLQMNIELADGRRVTVASNGEWKTSPGPITYNDLAHGERYDAQLEQPGWNAPGFDDRTWTQVIRVGAPTGQLVAQTMPPVRVVETLPVAHRITPTSPMRAVFKAQVFDFGQNFTGWVRLRVQGPRGTRLEMTYGTRIYPENSTIDARSSTIPSRSLNQTDVYILKGEGIEVWEPRFTLHGFRYVQILGLSDQVHLQNIEGRVVHAAVDFTGTFHSSNHLLNRIHNNIHWTIRSGLQGIPQDANDRDERVAWLGDPTFVIEDHLYNFDLTAFWEKWLADIQDIQRTDGALPALAPDPRLLGYDLDPSWHSTYPVLAWKLYWYYGDRRVLEEHYPNLKKLADYQSAAAKNDLIADEPIGDHMEPQPEGYTSFYPKNTPSALTANVHYFACVLIVARTAEVLGKRAEAEQYFARAERIKAAFNRRFFDPRTHRYATGSQTSQALPLEWGMAPKAKISGIMQALLADIRDRDMHVTTGIIGTNSLVQVLPRYGAIETLYTLANQTSFPSLGHQVMKGATTVCETYECDPWNSQNMKMLVSWDKFFYRDLAGISPASPGYRRVLIQPHPAGDLKSVTATQTTIRGLVSVAWTRNDESFDLKVSIPAGAEADIAVPTLGRRGVRITESESEVWALDSYRRGTPGLTGATADADAIVFHAGSGNYHFIVHHTSH